MPSKDYYADSSKAFELILASINAVKGLVVHAGTTAQDFKDTLMETMRALLKACSVPVDQRVVEEDECWIYVKNFSCAYDKTKKSFN